ncbi:hypothetical protein BpHYR1_025317 [Brachionus plicatilis]|uniref:Uncharacterized protein n=1 Tax=Brachionus plicatilis TaxID=10195 RepID=A0A3M7PMH3_BRAPC|nr:hypothetical protein BpHYR1_025317 [Brachionus plicatilis]
MLITNKNNNGQINKTNLNLSSIYNQNLKFKIRIMIPSLKKIFINIYEINGFFYILLNLIVKKLNFNCSSLSSRFSLVDCFTSAMNFSYRVTLLYGWVS